MIKLMSTIAVVGASFLGSSSLYSLELEKRLSLNANSLKSAFVDTGAGSLTIEGKRDLSEIQLVANIKVDGVDSDEADEWMQDYMNLSITEKNGKAIVCASFSYSRGSTCSTRKKLSSNWFGWNNDRKIDLVVYVPESLDLEVDDGSGWINISDIKADLLVDDGSGSTEINNIVGNLKVDDGSGDLTINDIDGDIYIDDGSGKLFIDKVTGEVEIEDGSGDIKITNVAKKVYIDDGSGSVKACHLGASLTVDDGSGSVDTCDDIKGKVVIK